MLQTEASGTGKLAGIQHGPRRCDRRQKPQRWPLSPGGMGNLRQVGRLENQETKSYFVNDARIGKSDRVYGVPLSRAGAVPEKIRYSREATRGYTFAGRS